MHLSSFQRHRRMGSGASYEKELDAHPHQGAWVAAGRPRLDADHLPDRPGPLPQATAALGHRGRTGKFTMLPRRLPPPQAENPGNRGDGSELVESSWVHGGGGQATRERQSRDRGAVELRPAVLIALCETAASPHISVSCRLTPAPKCVKQLTLASTGHDPVGDALMADRPAHDGQDRPALHRPARERAVPAEGGEVVGLDRPRKVRVDHGDIAGPVDSE